MDPERYGQRVQRDLGRREQPYPAQSQCALCQGGRRDERYHRGGQEALALDSGGRCGKQDRAADRL